MSTKMYNLYRVEGKSIQALFAWLVETRKQYYQHVREKMSRCVEREGLERITDQMERYTRSGYNGMFNIEASAVVYLYEGGLYVQLFGLHGPFGDTIEKTPFLVDFHYQDQTDKPSDIPDDEWNERERIVEAILDIDSGARASRCGLVFQFADVNDVFSIMYGEV